MTLNRYIVTALNRIKRVCIALAGQQFNDVTIQRFQYLGCGSVRQDCTTPFTKTISART